MSSFFSSLANKAQTAYEQSPLAGQVADLQSKLQQQIGGSSADKEHPTANEAAAQGGYAAKSRTLGNLTHQFRNIQMQISTVGPVQRIITTEKSVVLDFDSASRDSKSFSKELYMWGQHEAADLKDVTDRLAYLNFVHGALSETLAGRLDASRTHLKALRDAEKALEPKRNIRAGLENQIGRIEHEQPKGSEKRLAELKQQLQRAEAEDEAAEKQVEILKRKAVAESEKAKWEALREYGEKLVLLAEASSSIVSALPPVPPSAAAPYNGAQTTAQTRAALQHALDNYKPGTLTHSFQPSAADLNRSDSRSFGVTHATELSNITTSSTVGPHSDKASVPITPPEVHTDTSGAVVTPPPLSASSPTPSSATAPIQAPAPVNPAALNNAPAPIPSASPTTSPNVQANVLRVTPTEAQKTSTAFPAAEPTVAETGVPLSAGASGPGPSSGSIHDLKAKQPSPAPVSPASAAAPATAPSIVPAPPTPAKYESAEDEKNRLQREERERLLHGNPVDAVPAQKYETAEEEKKRLEKEEKERLLKEGNHGASSGQGGPDPGAPGGDPPTNPPPYQDF